MGSGIREEEERKKKTKSWFLGSLGPGVDHAIFPVSRLISSRLGASSLDLDLDSKKKKRRIIITDNPR